VREGAPTFAGVASEIRSYAFRKKPREEQATLRALRMKAVEAKYGAPSRDRRPR
jgi:hypothetical protein